MIDVPFKVDNGHLLLLTVFELVGDHVHLHSTMEIKQLDWKRHFLLESFGSRDWGSNFLRNSNRPIENLPIERPISGVHALRG